MRKHSWVNLWQIYWLQVDTTLREFQYKYLMHRIPNNHSLFKGKLKSHNIFDFWSMCLDSKNIRLGMPCNSAVTDGSQTVKLICFYVNLQILNYPMTKLISSITVKTYYM